MVDRGARCHFGQNQIERGTCDARSEFVLIEKWPIPVRNWYPREFGHDGADLRKAVNLLHVSITSQDFRCVQIALSADENTIARRQPSSQTSRRHKQRNVRVHKVAQTVHIQYEMDQVETWDEAAPLTTLSNCSSGTAPARLL